MLSYASRPAIATRNHAIRRKRVKAVVFHEFGGPQVLRLEEVATPVPGPGEVLIDVRAVSVNRTLDLAVRAGRYAHRPPCVWLQSVHIHYYFGRR